MSACTLVVASFISGQSAAYDGQCSTLQDVNELPPGHWCEVPNSHLRSVEKKPADYSDWNGSSSPSYDSYQRINGVSAVIANWGGGAFDSRRDRLLVKGGGHNGYGGNEVYAFELRNLRWQRITDPTPFPNRCASTNPDNTPTSRHTYGGLGYIESTDDFFVLGGALDCSSGGVGAAGTWLLDLTELERDGTYSPAHWKLGSAVNEPDTRAEDDAVYDRLSGKMYYQYGPSASGWSSFHALSDTWENLSAQGIDPGATAVIAGDRRFIIHFGAGVANGYVRWGDLDRGSFGRTVVSTTGAKEMESARNPGAAYESLSDRVVSWSGGETVFSLDVSSNNWERHDPASGNLANPGPVNAVGGTYGRFAYSESLNVFVVVDSVDENVFIYRFAPGQGTTPNTVPNPPSALDAQ